MNPPTFLRHITPWWLLSFIDKHSDYCWANMVMWKIFGDKSWKRESICFGGTPEPYDWCGKFKSPAKFLLLALILMSACGCGVSMQAGRTWNIEKNYKEVGFPRLGLQWRQHELNIGFAYYERPDLEWTYMPNSKDGMCLPFPFAAAAV